MSTLWQCLEAFPRIAAFPCDWRDWLGQDFEPFKVLCLQKSQIKPVSFPCPLHTSCAYSIIPFVASTLDPEHASLSPPAPLLTPPSPLPTPRLPGTCQRH